VSIYNSRRRSEAAARADERRKREDDAPRLKDEVPSLAELRLELEELSGESRVQGSRHTRLVVVDRAPALFDLPCADASCAGGGHDLTYALVRQLRAGRTEFGGEDTCHGSLGTASTPCRRVLRWVAKATYRG
jgi:hypothetical protein